MDKVQITGGKKLKGTVRVSGAKNAALPVILASLLSDQPFRVSRVPTLLQDIATTHDLLKSLGVKIQPGSTLDEVIYDAAGVSTQEAPYDIVRKMRASVLVLGPLLSRFGRARVSLPGGCAIGARPVNFHLTGLEKLGAKIELEGGYINASASRLRGARVRFDFPSVGATENLMMAAALAQGETCLENCAREPEIVDLGNALRAMGAVIEGDGTETIRIQGQDRLKSGSHALIGDRIEAGTYLAAAMITQGEVTVQGLDPESLGAVLDKFEGAGAKIERGKDHITLRSQGRPRAVDLETQPYPGYPTDMQAQLMAVLTVADGASQISENIFENRFMHVSELTRLGADITVKGNHAVVRGKSELKGAPVMATDLRASASLIVAGLVAQGTTTVSRIYHLDRGYENMVEKLKALGADVVRVEG